MPHSFRQKTLFRLITLALCVLIQTSLLTGCSSINENLGFSESEDLKSADDLAIDAMDSFNVGRYRAALTAFEEILDRYPFSTPAMLAELKSADCHYYLEEYQEAKLLYEEFKERHPTNEAIPYVMFQIAMSDLSQTDRIDRNVSGAKYAIDSFTKLLRAFPDSPYTQEAKARIRAAREFLVNHEFYVAVFYIRTEKYDEAKHRLKYLLTTYPDAMIQPRAKQLLDRLEAGDPPKMGVNKWLPDLTMPDFNLF